MKTLTSDEDRAVRREILQVIAQGLAGGRVVDVGDVERALCDRHPDVSPVYLRWVVHEVVQAHFNPPSTPAGHRQHAEELARYLATRRPSSAGAQGPKGES